MASGALFGDARAIAVVNLRREAADRGILVRVAVAGDRTARAHAGACASRAHDRRARRAEAATLAPLPVRALDCPAISGRPPPEAGGHRLHRPCALLIARRRCRRLPGAARGGGARPAHPRWCLVEARDPARVASIDTFSRLGHPTARRRWRRCHRPQLSARFGTVPARLQRLARGEDDRAARPARCQRSAFEAHLDSRVACRRAGAVLVRARPPLLEPMCAHLERRDGRAAAALIIAPAARLEATRSRAQPAAAGTCYSRHPRVLRTLALLDLESHPPGAGIDGVIVRVEPTPGRVLQFSLLERALPAPEQLSTLLARLSALMGQDRCGSARILDTVPPGCVRDGALRGGARRARRRRTWTRATHGRIPRR